MNRESNFDELAKTLALCVPRRRFLYIVGLIGGIALTAFGIPRRAFGKVLYDFADLKRAGHPVGNDGSICFYVPAFPAFPDASKYITYGIAHVPTGDVEGAGTSFVFQTGNMKCVYPDNRLDSVVAVCPPNDDGSQRSANHCREDMSVDVMNRNKFDQKYGSVVLKDGILIKSSKQGVEAKPSEEKNE
jgi:hypothetical protein